LHTFTQFDAPLGGTSVTRSFLADVDGDGKSDLVVRTSGAIASARSIGDGTFDAFASVTGPTFTAEEVGDLNADGTDDLAAFTNGKLRVYSGTSLGLTAPCVFPATGVDGTDAATSIGDLTDDGAADLAAAEGGGQNGAATV